MNSKAPSLLQRIRVVLGLLISLRGRDWASARQLMNTRFAGYSTPMRMLRLLSWSFDVMWRKVPESMTWLSTASPLSTTPYWLTAHNPLAGYPWKSDAGAKLPESAEVVVVGAGFGGASVAYHWSKLGSRPLIVLERNEAASGAAGRNGGIVVTAGGAYHGYYVYEPVLKYMSQRWPELSESERVSRATNFADVYVRAVADSHEKIKLAMTEEGIQCDYAQRGWVFFTDEISQERLEASLSLGDRLDQSDWVRCSPGQVRAQCGASTDRDGARSIGSAT